METTNKIKLSSDLIFTKLISVFGFLLCLILVFSNSKSTVDDDFKTNFEYKLFLIATTVLTGYLLTRPNICYDETNLYIKKINKNETLVLLKNVTSFSESLFVNKGTAIYTIEYTTNSLSNDSIKFAANYSSETIKNFKMLLKKINPHMDIV